MKKSIKSLKEIIQVLLEEYSKKLDLDEKKKIQMNNKI